jgi:hypothetical protein
VNEGMTVEGIICERSRAVGCCKDFAEGNSIQAGYLIEKEQRYELRKAV